MATVGRTLLRVAYVVCLIALFCNIFAELLGRIVGILEDDEPKTASYRLPPKPTNPGYGDARTEIDLDADIEDDSLRNLAKQTSPKVQMLATIKNACLPKLICELNARPERDKLTESERYLLSLLRDTTISTMAELSSKYHFAAHMGQLIAGVDGNGCHNFYPSCPFPGFQVLQMMKKVRMR